MPFDVNIQANAKGFLSLLYDKIKKSRCNKLTGLFDAWKSQVRSWRDKYDPVKAEYFEETDIVHPYAFFRLLSQEMDANSVLVGDCGGNIVCSNHAFKTKWGQRNITNNGNSPMGFSLPGAIGAWFADPSRQVVCTIGDGGFQMNIQELQTYFHYNISVKVFIINNQCYGITRQFQKTNFQGRMEACGPKGYSVPNFIKIAEAYGLKTEVINSIDEAESKIRSILDYDGAVICDVFCKDYEQYLPRLVGWNTPIEDMEPYLPRNEFKKNMLIEPLKGWEKLDY